MTSTASGEHVFETGKQAATNQLSISVQGDIFLISQRLGQSEIDLAGTWSSSEIRRVVNIKSKVNAFSLGDSDQLGLSTGDRNVCPSTGCSIYSYIKDKY